MPGYRPDLRSAPDPAHALARHPDDGWTMAMPWRMDRSTRRAFRALIRAVCPPTPTIPGMEGVIEVHVRRMMRYMAPAAAMGFVVAIHFLDWAPRWTFSGWRRLRKLDVGEASAWLERLGQHRFSVIRTMVFGVRGAVLSTYFDQTEVHRAMDYEPAPFIASRIALRKRLLEGGEATEADLILPTSEVAA